MSDCTYKLTLPDGQERTIIGKAAMKAFLVQEGVSLFYPNGFNPNASTQAGSTLAPPDLNAMFNDVLAEEIAKDEAKAQKPGTPKAQAKPRTASQAAASAAKNTAAALTNAIDGLGALFGQTPPTDGTINLNSGIPVKIDADTYAKAKPLFQQAIANLGDAGSDLKEAMRAVVRMVLDKFGIQVARNMQPYVVQFIEDVQNERQLTNGEQDVPSADARVERDSNEPATERAMVPTVPRDAGDVPGAAGQAGGQAAGTDGRGQPGDSGVPAGGAAADRERGDFSVPGGVAAADAASIATGDQFSERGSDVGFDGVRNDPIPAAQVDAVAVRGPDRLAKLAQQRAAEKVAVKPGDLDNIKATLPYLLEGQQEDVLKAETRFAKPDGYGMLFTNGTGTGKTFTGLGVVKRMQRQGKTNVLIVVPDDKIAADWVKSGEPLGLSISGLKDTKDAGKGIVITTYANLGENDALARRQWDMVVADEAHTLMQSADGKVTTYLANLRAITHHPDGAYQRHTMLNRKDIDALAKISEQITANTKILNNTDTVDAMMVSVRAENERLQKEADALSKKLREASDAVRAEVADMQGSKRARLLALSATPFAYEFTVDWANGYLFDYNEGQASDKTEFRGYNQGSNRDRFFMTRFGYTMRYNKLTKPDPAKVDSGLMQREFNTWLKKSGSLSGRMLDVPADYDRRFVLVDSGIGNQIDDALNWINEKRREAKQGDLGFATLNDTINDKFDYLSRRYLLEAIKATEVVPIVRQHMALGRKVVVFHDYKKGGGFNPFDIKVPGDPSPGATPEQLQDFNSYKAAVAEFRAKFKDLVNAPLSQLDSPIEVFKREIPGVLLVNGDEKKAALLERYEKFQDDASGPQVMLVQSAKNKGWSGHDTTGKHQRVLINLGQPTAPTMAIQQEGRIYRTGQVTDAIMRYLNTGTSWERMTFAQTIAGRASAAENLGMGEQARALKDAFIDAFNEADTYAPGHEGEGKGGKERDKMANAAITAFDRAKTYYWGNQKKTSKTKAQEGKDYFATPEPLGYKMAEWLGLRGGESVLEPSAGHGAIARWLPENTNRTAIEPSNVLRARLAMAMDASKDRLIDGTFEDHAIVNKYDGIVMNPPFGVGGKTAIEHLAKAATHLRDGGRIVALIPTGPAADKRFDQWMYGESERPTKPLYVHPEHGPIYKGDTVETGASWAPVGIVKSYSSEYGVAVRSPKNPSDVTSVSVKSIMSVKPTGQRTETYRAAEGIYTVAEIKLPQVTFERAGTAVATRIVILEKQTDAARAPNARTPIDLSDIADIGKLFDRIEDMKVQPRAMTAAQEAADKADKAGAQPAKKAEAKTPKAANPAAVGTVDRGDAKVIEHITQKGKTIYGIVRKDLSKEAAQKIDPYTFRKDGGFFIRTQYLKPEDGAEGDTAPEISFSRADQAGGGEFSGAGVNWVESADQSAAAKVARAIRASMQNQPGTYDYTIVEPEYQGSSIGNRLGLGPKNLTDALYQGARGFESAFGRRVVFVRAERGSPSFFNGFILPKSDPNTIYVNIDGNVNLMSILGHEFYEGLLVQNPGLHSWFVDQARRLMNDGALQVYSDKLAKLGDTQDEAGRLKELLADFTGDALADPEFRRSLERSDQNKFRQLIRAFRNFLIQTLGKMRARMTGSGLTSDKTLGSEQYFKDVQALRDALREVIQKANSGGNLKTYLGNGWVMFSRRTNAGNSLPRAVIGHRLGALNNHPSYAAAKSGDAEAAMRVALDLVDDSMVQRVREAASGGEIVIPVVSVEASGRNKIPLAVAEVLAARLGASASTQIVQMNSPKRTNMDGLSRLLNPPEFEGDVRPGAQYVLVDDTLTQGATFAAMASHIRSGGGDVSAVVALTGKEYSAKLMPDPELLRKVRERFQSVEDDFQAVTGYGFDALTESEARYLANFDDAESVRNRILEARSASGRTVDAQEAGGDGLYSQKPADVNNNPDIRFSRATAQPTPASANWVAPSLEDAKHYLAWDNIVYTAQDKMVDIKRVQQAIAESGAQLQEQQDVYLQEELYHARVSKKSQEFVQKELDPMVKLLADNGVELADFEQYLHARHAPEANRVMMERNPTEQELQARMDAIYAQIEPLQAFKAKVGAKEQARLQRLIDQGIRKIELLATVQPWRGTEEDRQKLSGMSNQEAAAVMASLSPETRQTMEEAARQFDAIVKKNRQEMVDYDLENQDTVDGWADMFEFYVPLMREDEGNAQGTGQGFSIKGREVKSRTGSTKKVVDIVANLAMQRERTIVRGEKNRVSQALVGLASANPNPDFWRVGSPDVERKYDPRTGTVKTVTNPNYKNLPNVVTAKLRGADGAVKEVAVVFNEKDNRAARMASTLKNLDGQTLEGMYAKVAPITRFLSSMSTQYNPIFGVVNLARDLQGAMVNLAGTPLADQKGKIAALGVKAVADIYRAARADRQNQPHTGEWSKWWDMFQEDGGPTGYRDIFQDSADRTKAITKTMNPDAWMESAFGKVVTANGQLKDPISALEKGRGFIFDWLSDYNLAMENGIRVSTYRAAVESEMSRERAASLAKNITVNFNRKGQMALKAGALYAFFNAAMQGNARIGETLLTMDPGKPKTMRLSPLGKKVVYGGILLGALQAAVLAAMGFDEENPPDFVRERNLLLPSGWGGFFMSPMPLGLHVFPGLGRHLTEFALSGGKDPQKRAIEIMAMIFSSFYPLGSAGISAQTLAPTAVDPFIALIENKDYAGRPIARESMDKNVPGHELTRTTATWISQGIAEGINWITGGDKYVAGVVSLTPDQIDYLIGQATGGVGREILKAVQTGQAIYTGEELPAHKIPLVGRFFGTANGSASQSGPFYAKMDEAKRIDRRIDGLREDGQRQEAQTLERSHQFLLAKARIADRQVTRLRREKRKLLESGAPREQVRDVERQMADAMRRFNEATAK